MTQGITTISGCGIEYINKSVRKESSLAAMWKKSYFALVTLAIVILVLFVLIYSVFFSMHNLPKGEFLCEAISPQGTYTVNLYESNTALSAGGIRGEVVNNKTGKKQNIYWEYARNLYEARSSGTEIIWLDDDTVVINSQQLNLPNDVYDFRRVS